jgi:pyruvate dehydrogenase E2 component (dihydrolipoamide acetyltransferase)
MDEFGKRIRDRKKITGARKYIGAKMAESLRDYPQGSGSSYLTVTKLLELKKELKAENKNVTTTSLIVKLMAEALQRNIVLNSALIEDELIIYDSINVGVGIGLEEGIMTVVVKEAQTKDIFQISDELQDMINRLKNKKLQIEEIKGSTVTLSNMGMLGVEQATPFLNPPETFILAMGTTKKQIVVHDDNRTSIEEVACFSTTINHAAVDGYHGGKFILSLKEMLTEPEKYMGLREKAEVF